MTGGPASPAGLAGPVAGQFVYTARTANDAAIALPAVVQAGLRQDGLAHQSTELTRVDYTGTVSTSDVDLTPRTGNSPQDPALKVNGRALPAIDAKISPIPQVPGPKGVTCTVPQSYFVLNTADLVDAAKTIRDLTPCVTAALAAHATFALDGWTSYEGPLNAAGQPAFNDPANITLSQERVQAIANLLVNDLAVPASAITRTTGHGNLGQPHPDPRSAANRVVVITYTIK